MTRLLFIFIITIFGCKEKVISKPSSHISVNQNQEFKETGYLFIDIAEIYHNGGELFIQGADILIKNSEIIIEDKTFDIINDEYIYTKLINVDFFFPEYGLFILKARKDSDGDYEVLINGKVSIINSQTSKEFLTYKTPNEYIMEAYPIPTINTPVRKEPNDNSEAISNFQNYTYVPIEIKGDWLKIKDDKECYPGESPSNIDVIGWVRWKKDGKVIIKVAHSC